MKRSNLITRAQWLSLTLLLTAFAPSLRAQSTTEASGTQEDKWRMFSVPYLWAAGLEGDVTIKGVTADVDVGFDTIKDHLQGALMTYIEVRRDKFGFFANPMFMKLEADGSIFDGGDADFEQKLWIVELGGFYNLGSWGENHPVTLDALGGGRYWNNDMELDVSGPIVGTRSLSRDEDLTDLFAGFRVHQRVTERLSWSVRADVGGFGIIGDSSDFSWNAMALLGFELTKHFTLWGGYRALSVDKEHGSGASKRGLDLTLHGPIIGLEIRF